jgi:hypothetical protein
LPTLTLIPNSLLPNKSLTHRKVYPTKRSTDPEFVYTHSTKTNISKTFQNFKQEWRWIRNRAAVSIAQWALRGAGNGHFASRKRKELLVGNFQTAAAAHTHGQFLKFWCRKYRLEIWKAVRVTWKIS